MSGLVEYERMDTGVREKHFQESARGRIALKYGPYLFPEKYSYYDPE